MERRNENFYVLLVGEWIVNDPSVHADCTAISWNRFRLRGLPSNRWINFSCNSNFFFKLKIWYSISVTRNYFNAPRWIPTIYKSNDQVLSESHRDNSVSLYSITYSARLTILRSIRRIQYRSIMSCWSNGLISFRNWIVYKYVFFWCNASNKSYF